MAALEAIAQQFHDPVGHDFRFLYRFGVFARIRLGPHRRARGTGIEDRDADLADFLDFLRVAFEEVVERYYRRWDLTHSEDNEICELQQSGITSPLAQAGRLARRERGVHAVDFWVVEQLLAGSEDDSRAAAE